MSKDRNTRGNTSEEEDILGAKVHLFENILDSVKAVYPGKEVIEVRGPKDEIKARKAREEIGVLESERETLEERLVKKKTELAKAEGYVFESILDLVKATYPGGEIIEEKGCFYLGRVSEETKAKIPNHYECPSCGIVPGGRHLETESAEGPLSDDSGTYINYKCWICSSLLERDNSGVMYGF